MDKIYPPEKYKNSGPLQHVFFLYSTSQNFILPKTPYNENSRRKEILELMDMDIDEDMIKKLEKKCSPKLLTGENPLPVSMHNFKKTKFMGIPVTDEALEYECVKKRQDMKIAAGFSLNTYLKYRSEIRIREQEIPDDTQLDLIPGENSIMKIRLYHPFKYVIGVRGTHPTFYISLVVYGSQPLTVLRDKIICPSELSSCLETSNDPDGTPLLAKNVFQSGFFFIDNTFYNDMRNSQNIDYSECIMEWAKTKPEIGEFKKKSMADVTFNELNINLGYPCVYKHLGNCEHIFVFSDIEVLQPSDLCASSVYPMYVSWTMKKGKFCHMCGLLSVKWCVTESDRVPFDPAYFCENCFVSYNYVNGVKVGNFKAYPYLDSVNAF